MRKGIINILIILLFLVQISCNVTDDLGENPSIISSKYGFLSIEPDTILQEIKIQTLGIFKTLDTTPNINTEPVIPPINWSQNDYQQIAEAVHQEVWNEPIDNWEMNYIFFSAKCTEIDDGLQLAAFKFFKYDDPENDIRGKITYHRIVIDPRLKYIEWGEEILSMSSGNVDYFESSQFNVSADEGLQISDENGGKIAREDIKNNCYVHIYPVNGDSANGWEINYYETSSSNLIFRYTVD
jgi:hypothetical protein